jgi:hypothetical protein
MKDIGDTDRHIYVDIPLSFQQVNGIIQREIFNTVLLKGSLVCVKKHLHVVQGLHRSTK